MHLPASTSPLLICEYCDSVYRRLPLARGEVARCRRCDAILERRARLDLDGLQAMTLTGLILFVIANSWPIMTISLGGQQQATTLWGMAAFMWNDGYPLISAITVFTLLVVPFLRMGSIVWMLGWARRGWRAPGFAPTLRVLAAIQPWAMVEVFVLGVLVAIVKSSSYYDVSAGYGIVAYGALTILATVIASVDVRGLWELPLRNGGEPVAKP